MDEFNNKYSSESFFRLWKSNQGAILLTVILVSTLVGLLFLFLQAQSKTELVQENRLELRLVAEEINRSAAEEVRLLLNSGNIRIGNDSSDPVNPAYWFEIDPSTTSLYTEILPLTAWTQALTSNATFDTTPKVVGVVEVANDTIIQELRFYYCEDIRRNTKAWCPGEAQRRRTIAHPQGSVQYSTRVEFPDDHDAERYRPTASDLSITLQITTFLEDKYSRRSFHLTDEHVITIADFLINR